MQAASFHVRCRLYLLRYAWQKAGLRLITRGKRELPSMLDMKNGNLLFQRKNKSSCLFVLNVSVQQVLTKKKKPKSWEDEEEECVLIN